MDGSPEGCSDSEIEVEVGKLILERTPPRERLLCFLGAADSASPLSSAAITENSASGERCRTPPPGVGGALAAPTSTSSPVTAIEGPASGEDRRGRAEYIGEEMVLCRRLGDEERSGKVSW